VTEKPSDTLKS